MAYKIAAHADSPRGTRGADPATTPVNLRFRWEDQFNPDRSDKAREFNDDTAATVPSWRTCSMCGPHLLHEDQQTCATMRRSSASTRMRRCQGWKRRRWNSSESAEIYSKA